MSVLILGKYYKCDTTKLNLCHDQLIQIPPEIGQLQQLQKLSLSDNQLTQIPPEIGQLQQLQYLCLYNNQITQLPPEIGQLRQLRYLGLSNNQLTQIPLEIGQLQQLQKLYLHNNRLTQIPPEIGQLQQLRELGLSNNQLTELPFTIINLRLIDINISNNPLENIYPPITRWIHNIQNRSKTSQNVYQNKQSVHDHNIEKTTNESIINFLTSFKYQKTQNLEILINDLNISTTSKQLLLNYSLENYIHSVLQMKYSEIIEPILYFIINHEHKEELLKILDQEIIESQGKCLQGRISRTINILNGYHDSVKINISDNEQISNLIINLQNKFNNLFELKDNFIKEMIERNYKNEIIDEWIKHIDENV